MKKIILLLMLFPLVVYSDVKKLFLEMPAIFSNNMVLQQKTKVPFWGKATPGINISIKASWGKNIKTVAGSDSIWTAKLKTPKAGGPYALEIKFGDSTIVYRDVLIGEVWLCSGQSNMEMPLRGWPPADTISGSQQAIKEADYPNLRFFTVARAYSNKPEKNCTGTWSKCSPATAAGFSATAFFFGWKLNTDLKIPIGLIHSSWGGTPIESWTSSKYLSQFEQFKEVLKKIDESKPDVVKFDTWIRNHPVIDITGKEPLQKWKGLDFQDSICAKPNFDDSKWKTMNLPMLWESTEVGDFDGVIWFRKQINISKNWLNKELVVELGPIDDVDVTYINGRKIGGYEEDGFWQVDRVYTIPSEIVTDTLLTIAIRVVDSQGGGGIWGKKEKMKLHPKDSNENITLAGNWKYLPVAQFIANKFYVFGIKDDEYASRPKISLYVGPNMPTSLYNGMIAPLIPYSIKGVIWYQGEANVANAELYQHLLPNMITNWREDWQEKNFPFYFVQIAPWEYGSNSQSQKLREAQLKSLSTAHSGMAVTMDIGSPRTIHPSNKKDVGKRLAFWALAKDYNKKIVYSGPIYKTMEIVKDKIILSFKYADKGLVLKIINGSSGFTIAGENKIFKKADVKIEGKKLVVSCSEVIAPKAVRYGWSNYADGSLFNKAGLPASSFRTDDWGD